MVSVYTIWQDYNNTGRSGQTLPLTEQKIESQNDIYQNGEGVVKAKDIFDAMENKVLKKIDRAKKF